MRVEGSPGYRALTEGCGLIDRSAVGRLRLSGEDRARFLQGLVTCDVGNLASGAGVYGFFTSLKGRILADVAVLAREGELLLELPPGRDEEIREHLLRYKIADRVEAEAADDLAPVTIAGPGAGDVLRGLGIETPGETWASAGAEVAGVPVLAVRQGHLGVDGITLWSPADRAAAVADALTGAGAVEVDEAAAETVRIEAGVPRFGADFGPENFPQETGFEDAVSYQKGCYLGQEIVARIHYRGGVQRGLRGLTLEPPDGASPAPGAELSHDGRPAGRLSSVARSPRTDRWIGLSILHLRAAEPGTELEIQGGGCARVRDQPI